MISILIVDDNNDKISEIISVVREKYDDLTIEVEADSFSTQKALINKKFDLLILDLNLPFRKNDLPNPDGGKILLQEINRNERIKSPNFVVGLSQYTDETTAFSDVWSILKYDPSDATWSYKLMQIIAHAVKSRKSTSTPASKIETVFVEGKSDKKILIDAIKLFYPEYLSKIVIKDSDGASFVSRNVIIWAKSLSRNNDNKFIRSVGLLDGDEKGTEAKSEINRVMAENSAELQTFKIVQLNKKYAKHLIPVYSKGVNIPITIEELFPCEIWKYAQSENWLAQRSNLDDFLSDPKSWDKFNISLKDYLSSLQLSADEIIFILKFKKECKDDFCKYLFSLDEENKRIAYANVKILLEDIIALLFK